jgi:lipoprotein-releasing system permease protein
VLINNPIVSRITEPCLFFDVPLAYEPHFTKFALLPNTTLLNFELFIVSRLLRKEKRSKNYTRPIINISIAAIALGIIVMTLTLAIVAGFQNEIRDKVIGFGAHIQIGSFESRNSLESKPISRHQDFYPSLDTVPGIRHIQVFGIKPGIIKTKEQIQGVVLKGVAPDFDWQFFESKLVSGKTFTLSDSSKSNAIIISKQIANKLELEVEDKITIYFIQQPPRARKFTISGIYETGFGQYDEMYCLIDLQHIQKLNGWSTDEVSGFEVLLHDFRDLRKMDDVVYQQIGFDLNSTNIADANPDIFNWLELQDINVIIIIVLMLIVAAINIISALLILILDRINMIGTLKALGASNWNIRKIFLWNATFLIAKGLFWGNAIGLSLAFLQKQFELVKLPQESYYVAVVPIHLDWVNILLLNAGTLLVCVVVLILPSYVITKIKPIQAIRFT